jgi:subtilase family serine protease
LQSAAQQANAQGITWVASSGDSGAAECDPAFNASNAQATQGQYPSFPTTIPEVTGVGGTQFNEGSGNYWAASNSPNGGSALSYIPEKAWNESSANGIASSGGGLSIF